MGVIKPIFSVPLIPLIFRIIKTLVICMLSRSWLTGVNHSWAAKTPDKYERDLKYLAYTLSESNFPGTEKLTNGVLVVRTSVLALVGDFQVVRNKGLPQKCSLSLTQNLAKIMIFQF